MKITNRTLETAELFSCGNIGVFNAIFADGNFKKSLFEVMLYASKNFMPSFVVPMLVEQLKDNEYTLINIQVNKNFIYNRELIKGVTTEKLMKRVYSDDCELHLAKLKDITFFIGRGMIFDRNLMPILLTYKKYYKDGSFNKVAYISPRIYNDDCNELYKYIKTKFIPALCKIGVFCNIEKRIDKLIVKSSSLCSINLIEKYIWDSAKELYENKYLDKPENVENNN